MKTLHIKQFCAAEHRVRAAAFSLPHLSGGTHKQTNTATCVHRLTDVLTWPQLRWLGAGVGFNYSCASSEALVVLWNSSFAARCFSEFCKQHITQIFSFPQTSLAIWARRCCFGLSRVLWSIIRHVIGFIVAALFSPPWALQASVCPAEMTGWVVGCINVWISGLPSRTDKHRDIQYGVNR